MENEIWKAIDGYDGLYEVSNLGRFRRKTKTDYSYIRPQRHYRRMRITFTYQKKVVNLNFALLVAKAFIPNPDNKEIVEYIDGNPDNNRADNLKWSELSNAELIGKTVSEGKRKPNEYYIKDNLAYVGFTGTDAIMICDKDDWEKQKHITWFVAGGYVRARHEGKTLQIHRCIMDAPKGMEVDHINHNPLDNRRSNLRIVTHIVNMANRGRQSNNKTGTNGVYWNKRIKRFYCQINVNGKRKHLGCYKTYEEARSARIRAEYLYLIPFIEEATVNCEI